MGAAVTPWIGGCVSRIAVALSGGGHRATLFGLGVLLYLADAGKNTAVGSIASVSGGSLTNGYVAQELDYRSSSAADFWALAARLTGQIGRRGTLWASPLTWIYVVLLALGALATFIGVWFLPLAIVWRVVIFVVAFLLLALFAGLRGWICARAFARTLFSPSSTPTRLAATARPVDHVLCATDLHAGEHVYFSGRFVCAYRFGFGQPGDLALHDAVQASAAYPGGFAPRWFRTSRHQFAQAADDRAARTKWLKLVDGGAYDNLGDEWAQEVRTRNERWAELDPRLNEADELVLINSSAPLDWHAMSSLRVPVVGELVALKRDIDVLYDTTTSTRRRWLFDTFVSTTTSLKGAIVQITQSPFHTPTQFAGGGDDKSARAQAVLTQLGDTVDEWAQITTDNAGVKTTLSRLGPTVAARLVRHGYVLAMANLHVILGYPLLPIPPAARFAELGERV
jgi:predicted acylesterase/phospholipase RssA